MKKRFALLFATGISVADRKLELTRFLSMLRENVTRTVGGLPVHADYVAHHCGG